MTEGPVGGLADRIEIADLVVGGHKAEEIDAKSECHLEIAERDAPSAIDLDPPDDSAAASFRGCDYVQYGLMLRTSQSHSHETVADLSLGDRERYSDRFSSAGGEAD